MLTFVQIIMSAKQTLIICYSVYSQVIAWHVYNNVIRFDDVTKAVYIYIHTYLPIYCLFIQIIIKNEGID